MASESTRRRMIIEGHRQDCLADVLIIASALEAQDVRMRPIERQAEADAAHQKFIDPRSDFTSMLRVWDFYHRLKEDLSRSRLERLVGKTTFRSRDCMNGWIYIDNCEN